jgi:D-glycero-alpha-D-manno-heptose-7-phosphate kinase
MIITRAPLRISFAGGGTDLPEFWKRESGAVLSSSIDKYVYIQVHPYFEKEKILLKYSRAECVASLEEIQNDLMRESLRYTGIERGIEVTSTADLPTKTGLGSSCTFTVALLQALNAFKNNGKCNQKDNLSEDAYHIEREVLGRCCGKQDQYISAHGGLKHLEFNPDGSVYVNPVICQQNILNDLNKSLIMFYTNVERDAGKILAEQAKETENKRNTLRQMRDLSYKMRDSLISGSLDDFGNLLHEGWMKKREVTRSISNDSIDNYYEKGRKAGALGGKLNGAGGGGFLMFYCTLENQDRLRKELSDLKEVEFNMEQGGSRVIYAN